MAGPEITQAVIDAYDEYTHLLLDRRRFMADLTRLAVPAPLPRDRAHAGGQCRERGNRRRPL